MERSDELEPDPESGEVRFDGADGDASSGSGSGPELSHIETSPGGARSRMVDVGAKEVTARRALARAVVAFPEGELTSILAGGGPKGPIEEVARVAGIQAAKRTPELVPLAHPVAVHAVEVDLEVVDDGVLIRATVRTADRTGIEMEALTCVSVAGLAMVDMIKAVDKLAVITDVMVVAKSGGRSGDWTRPS